MSETYVRPHAMTRGEMMRQQLEREAVVLQHARQKRHDGSKCPWCRDVAAVATHYQTKGA